MIAILRTHVHDRISAWIARRSPRRHGPVTLDRRRIYILPTRGGAIFGVLLFAMLLGSMNYSNSLGFALTFLLAGMGLVAMHHTHRNLLHLTLAARAHGETFAGGPARFRLTLTNPTATARYAVRVDGGATLDAGVADLPAGATATLELAVPTTRRGRLALPRLRAHTEFPMGLFRAWSWVHPAAETVVYPAPDGRQPLPPPGTGEADGTASRQPGREDFAGLRRYARGDPPRLIHWKAVPRTGTLMTKQFSDPREQSLWLDWARLAPAATEARLAQLALWVLEADRAGLAYGLRLPEVELASGRGGAHRDRCLRRLALFAQPDDA